VLGTRQTGEVQFRIADLVRDQEMVPQVQALSDRLLADPQLVQALIKRWLGERVNYSAV